MFGLTTGASGSDFRDGTWDFEGEITHIRHTITGLHVTNTLKASGKYSAGKFMFRIIPIDTEDEIEETLAYDGNKLRVVQQFPEFPGRGLPRSLAGGFVEPTVFSNYAQSPSTAVLLALATTNALWELGAGKHYVLLGGIRSFPEEKNTYRVSVSRDAAEIEAICPGMSATPGGLVPIVGFEHGFTRWTFVSRFKTDNDFPRLDFTYRRFFPNGGELFEFRSVSGVLRVRSIAEMNETYQPPIPVDRLKVRDFSWRPRLAPFTKGASDPMFVYYLTNRIWSVNDEAMDRELSEIISSFKTYGLPDELKPQQHVAGMQIASRILLIAFLFLNLAAIVGFGFLVSRNKVKGEAVNRGSAI